MQLVAQADPGLARRGRRIHRVLRQLQPAITRYAPPSSQPSVNCAAARSSLERWLHAPTRRRDTGSQGWIVGVGIDG